MSIQILDVYSGNRYDLRHEIATGTDGVLFKGGQGALIDFPRVRPTYSREADDLGLPWGVFWQMDARISPEQHKANIKLAYPDANFGKLGLWLAVEKPFYPLPDWAYWLMRYSGYKTVESVWRGVQDFSGKYPGIYSSPEMWRLIFGKCPALLQQEIATNCDLWLAHHGAITPTIIGAWQEYALWQYQGEPDYSIASEKWWQRVMGQVVPPLPPAQSHMLEITVQTDDADAKLENATLDQVDVTASTIFHIKPTPPAPDPLPAPVPAPSSLGHYRILRDYEMPAKYWDGLSRTARPDWDGNPMTPATCRINGFRSSLKISEAAQHAVEKLNAPHGTFKYVTAHANGWVNGTFWPVVEQLTFEDNIVDVLRIEGNRAYIRTWHGEMDDPCVVHLWKNIDNQGRMSGTQNPRGDGTGYIVLCYPDGVWIELDKLVKVS